MARFEVAEFQVAGGSTIGGDQPVEERWVPTGGDREFTEPNEIGMDRPLFIRLHRVFTGPHGGKEMVVSSAVKSDTTFAGGPRAMHYWLPNIERNEFAAASAADDGSPIVYFTPSNLDKNLSLEIRLAFDSFDEDRYNEWVDLVAGAAGLPVFALSSAFGGILGGATGQAFVTAAAKGAKIVGKMLDRHFDNDNDFIGRHDIAIDLPGLNPAKAGWLLARGAEGTEVVLDRPTSEKGTDPLWGADSDTFYVDPDDGHLHYRRNGLVVNDLDTPYVLLHVSGVTSDKLKEYQITRVSADLLEKFFTPQSGEIKDIGELLSIYNDMTMTHRVKSLDKKVENASPEEKKKLLEQRESLLKHIQDEKLRDLLEEA